MSRIQLVIFDCDGVLVDSEPIAQRVLGDLLADLGVGMSQADVRRNFFGKTVPQCIELIERLTARPMSAELIASWRDRLYTAFEEVPVMAVDGVRDALSELRLPVCVVSNGPVRKMQTTLGVTGLLPRFEGRLYSSESGLPGKPAPDLFLAAASDFGVDPARVFVVEDSVKGVSAAVAAGMQVFGYAAADYVEGSELAALGATVFTDMRELPALIKARAPA